VLFKPQLLLPPHWSQGFNKNSGNTCWPSARLLLAAPDRLLSTPVVVVPLLVPGSWSTTLLAGQDRHSTHATSSGNHGTLKPLLEDTDFPLSGISAMPR
jgi:hypothetical protein